MYHSPAVTAPAGQAIVAVVNEEAISFRDVEKRLALFLVTGNLTDSQDMRDRLRPKVLSMLVDDTLKRQEARRLNVFVPGEDVDRALVSVAQQIQLPPEQLGPFLAARGVNLGTLREQIEVDMAWIRTVNRLASASVAVRDEEIEEELDRRRRAAGQPELRVAEIFLPLDRPDDEPQIRDLAGRLIEEIRQGASFPGLARIFSQGPAATTGGDLGWVRPGQLDPEIERVLVSLEPGQVAGPVRSAGGYHILVLMGRRIAGMPGGAVRLALHQVFIPLDGAAIEGRMAASIEALGEMTQGIADCDALAERAKGRPGVISGRLPPVDLRQLPPQLQSVVATMRAGEITPVMRSPDGVAAIMVCEREEIAPDEDIRNAVRTFLREQRLSTASRRLLRDLRRAAVVDYRS